ncbi:MAG: hypothetical protein FJ279_10120 [Planctomycetes bacterium]|nr:hypothetical protein [Planctomycetota bacterium]
MADAARLQAPNRRDAQGRLKESRIILDEGAAFLKDPGAVLDRITSAGFNVYMPCIWHGRGTVYSSSVAVPEPRFAALRQAKPTADPLRDLIAEAHKRGVEVHTWFCVGLRQANIYPEFAEPGTPAEFFDAQNPAFRDFIVNLIVDTARNYALDGINLDFIRTGGTSRSATAQRLYRERYNLELEADLKLASQSEKAAKERFLDWQDRAIGDIVSRVRKGLDSIRPGIVLSTCGHPRTKAEGLAADGRNDAQWLEKGWIDVALAMDYGRRLAVERHDVVRAESPKPKAMGLIAGNYDHDEAGKVVPREADLVAKLVDYCRRKYPGRAVALYIYSMLSDEQIKALRAGPFKEDAVACWE